MGVHRFPLMTTLELPKYREWLEARQKLANPNIFTWTWIQTHLPEWYGELLYNQAPRPSSANRSARSRSRFACWRIPRCHRVAAAWDTGRIASSPTAIKAAIGYCAVPCSIKKWT